MIRSRTALAATLFLCASAWAQVSVAPVEGLRETTPRVHALINARLEIAPGKTIPRGCLVMRDGLIVDAGADVQPPADARVWDLNGKTVYAGFIDAHSHFGLPDKWQPTPLRPEKPGRKMAPAPEAKPQGAGSWNPLVTPERETARAIQPDEKAAEKWRALGFTNAFVVPGRGIFRGQGALVDLDGGSGSHSLLNAPAAHDVAFEESRDNPDQYPDSLMGCIALIRQTFLDADWYGRAQKFYATKPSAGERPAISEPLAALGSAARGETPVIFETEDELDLGRVARIVDEFKLRGVLRGSGYEYRVLDELKASHLPVILPLTFPDVPEVESPEKALDVELDELEHWDEAPSNPARLAAAGVVFAITADGLDKPDKTFWKRLRLAVQRGLPEAEALRALTAAPAKMLGVEARCGTLEKGKAANLVVSSGDLFTAENAGVTATWIDGEPFETEKGRQRDPRGEYALTFEGGGINATPTLKLAGDPDKLKATVAGQPAAASIQGELLFVLIPAKTFGGADGIVRLAANLAGPDGALEGDGQLADGAAFHWRGKRTAPFAPEPKKDDKPDAAPIDVPPTYPAGAFGRRLDGPEASGIVLVQNATIWTCGPEGKLENADLLVKNGRIDQVGQGIIAPAGARIIDGAGLHVTPGLIDCHSHTAISRGVNEATHAVTCEVRIGDVLDATDIALYRELAGGVTTANILHGSANPIGGQNQPIKLRWGSLPEDLKFGGAMPGVKFALGENVKQSNWGDRYSSRYPQTRMGVEEIMRDTFLAARDYERKWDEYKKKPADVPPPRRDLRLEAALEILNRQRIVHIHSYRQDELLMFIRLSQELGFTVGTFQHVLEGYKVADEIAKIGAGASSFSDWWGYKYEVLDAIPYNGAMLQRAGVVVSYNSDSNELARRLNTEAAKAVKYGGLTEEQALDFVTINPAKQLRIDRQTGSLEAGKDADFVIWNGHPLSTYSRAEQTWLDGVCYFDYAADRQMRKDELALRERLIQKALPLRQKELGSDDAPKGDKDSPAPSEFERIVMHGAIHRALEFQGLYHNGADKHNCSTSAW